MSPSPHQEIVPRKHASGPGPSRLDISPLPSLQTFRLVYRALADQNLPPLPTTALHGALGHALKDTVCIHQPRPPCPGCEMLRICAYPALYEALPRAGGGAGVRDRAPAPWVVAPVEPYRGPEPIRLPRGGVIAFDLVLIGDGVLRHREVVVRALEEVGRRGLGVGPRRRDRRPPLALERFEATPVDGFDPGPEDTMLMSLRFITPLRLKSGGRIASRIDGRAFASSLIRRIDLLAQLYGSGPIQVSGPRPGPRPLAAGPARDSSMDPDTMRSQTRPGDGLIVDDSDLKLARTGRFSTRQDRRMEWPGLTGTLKLSGDDLPILRPLIEFGQRVHIGKATSFGHGVYRIVNGDVSDPAFT